MFAKTGDETGDVIIESRTFLDDQTAWGQRVSPVVNLYMWVDALQQLPTYKEACKEAEETLRDIFTFYNQYSSQKTKHIAAADIKFKNRLGVTRQQRSAS